MAYTNPLDPTTPSGGSSPALIDDRIREVKAALIERLLTLVTDVNAQPLVVKPGVIPAGALANDSVGQAQIANGAVGTGELIDRNITAVKIALLAITAAELADNAVTQLKMADNSVGTAEIIDANVTGPKLANDAVTQAKMANDSVGTAEIINANVTEPKLADDAVSTRTIDDGAVTAAKLAAGVVNSDTVIMLRASRVLSQAEAEIAGDSYEEYDITMVGAKVGYPVHVERTSTEPYPTTGAAPGAGGWLALSQMPAHAFCITADKIRVHVSNRTGGLTGPVGGCTMKVTQFQYADGH